MWQSLFRSTLTRIVGSFGYDLVEREQNYSAVVAAAAAEAERLGAAKPFPTPSQEMRNLAAQYFSNSFSISPDAGMTAEQVEAKLKSYYRHYPFEFDGRLIDASKKPFQGLRGRQYQRYCHIFPAILSLTGGSLNGKTVLDVASNSGFWSIQAKRAGATSVLGVEASSQAVELGKLILKIIDMQGIEYRTLNVYDLSKDTLGEFDITLFLGLLYHLNKPVLALERLYETTKNFSVVDTSLVDSPAAVLRLRIEKTSDRILPNNLVCFPSKSAVAFMLRHVGFREVFVIQNDTQELPAEYLEHRRATFIAIK